MRSRAKRRARRKEPGSRGGQRLHCTPPSAAAALACFVCAPPVRLHHIYMPLRPQTTRLSEKLNITQVAAQPSCTMKGSPWRCFVVVLLLWGCLCCGLRWRGRAVVGSAHGGRRRRRAEAGVGRRAAFCALLRGARGTCSGYGGCFGVGTGSTTTSAAWRMGGGSVAAAAQAICCCCCCCARCRRCASGGGARRAPLLPPLLLAAAGPRSSHTRAIYAPITDNIPAASARTPHCDGGAIAKQTQNGEQHAEQRTSAIMKASCAACAAWGTARARTEAPAATVATLACGAEPMGVVGGEEGEVSDGGGCNPAALQQQQQQH